MSKELINETWAKADPAVLGDGVTAGYVNLRLATALVAVDTPRYGIGAVFSNWPGADSQPKLILLTDWNGRSSNGDVLSDLTELAHRLHPAPSGDEVEV